MIARDTNCFVHCSHWYPTHTLTLPFLVLICFAELRESSLSSGPARQHQYTSALAELRLRLLTTPLTTPPATPNVSSMCCRCGARPIRIFMVGLRPVAYHGCWVLTHWPGAPCRRVVCHGRVHVNVSFRHASRFLIIPSNNDVRLSKLRYCLEMESRVRTLQIRF